MTKNLIKLMISSLLLIFFIGMSVLFCLKNVSLAGTFEFLSIESLISRKDDVLKKEQELIAQQEVYNETLAKLTQAQAEFDKEKSKYEAISDETIEIIKEATTQDNYNMEYMWIKLGNYARKNNLSLIVIEPGADDSSLTEKESNEEDTVDKSSTTNATDSNTTSTSGTTATSSSNNTASTSNTTDNNNANNTTQNASNDVVVVEEDDQDDLTMKIQLEGSYIDISDFIFEVENDDELKFKLDNILIEYVEGTTIKATFDVKNTIIVK